MNSQIFKINTINDFSAALLGISVDKKKFTQSTIRLQAEKDKLNWSGTKFYVVMDNINIFA